MHFYLFAPRTWKKHPVEILFPNSILNWQISILVQSKIFVHYDMGLFIRKNELFQIGCASSYIHSQILKSVQDISFITYILLQFLLSIALRSLYWLIRHKYCAKYLNSSSGPSVGASSGGANWAGKYPPIISRSILFFFSFSTFPAALSGDHIHDNHCFFHHHAHLFFSVWGVSTSVGG